MSSPASETVYRRRWARRRRAARLRRRFWPARRGLSPWVIALLYAVLAGIPLAIAAYAYPIAERPAADELATGLGLVAFALLLGEFVFSGRYRWISGRLGNERTMRVHRLVGYAMAAMMALHPFLYAAPGGRPWPWFSGTDPALGLGGWSLATALAAWIGVAALVVTAIDRRALPCRYETWRVLHAGGSLLVAALVAAHAWTAGGYSTVPALAAFWAVLLGGAAVSVFVIHGIRPWRQRRSPYVVDRVERVGDETWSLRLAARPGRGGHSALRFRPGQFAWLKIGGRTYGAREHPFSMSSAPEDAPTIGFTIKEKGDFTGGIGELEPGTAAFLDGPHGHFVPDEAEVPTVYIAGGVGIGPILSHLRAFRAEGDRRPITLIYGCHTPGHIAERAELDALAEHLDLTVHYIVRYPDASWTGRVGVIDRDLLAECLPAGDRTRCRYFICGPESMMVSVRRDLKRLGVPNGQIITGS